MRIAHSKIPGPKKLKPPSFILSFICYFPNEKKPYGTPEMGWGHHPFCWNKSQRLTTNVFFYPFLLTCNIIIASLVELSHVKLQADDGKHEDGHK